MKESKLSEGSKVPFDVAWNFILKVGVAAHKYGSTSTRLEIFLNNLSKRLGYHGVFKSTPAIVMLVSGTVGFRGLASMAVGDLALGAQQFFQMFIVAITILVGIMIGYTIVRSEPGL